ncbi:MAG TPA: LCCL domain-containing protein [Gemmataceae bacterium]|nr:LCCL domain-containing protein [Gemmataceae bacterium]
MKVIQQLIDYFEVRGKLGSRQKDQLIKKGYWKLHDPNEVQSLAQQVGQEFLFEVTGEPHGPLWGTDIYTSDSALAVACVHAGLLRVGEAGLVKVTMVKPLPIYKGTTRHGVTSGDWTTGWAGAYEVELIRK